MKDALYQLQSWYSSQCNGDWEHEWGVKIDTLDNPGWSVQIDLKGTMLAARKFESITVDRTDENWVYCKVDNDRFEGVGGADNLVEIVDIFLDWAKSGG